MNEPPYVSKNFVCNSFDLSNPLVQSATFRNAPGARNFVSEDARSSRMKSMQSSADAFVADKGDRPPNQFTDVVLALPAERAIHAEGGCTDKTTSIPLAEHESGRHKEELIAPIAADMHDPAAHSANERVHGQAPRMER